MTMGVRNNLAAVHTLNIFNRNGKEAQKYLNQVASGMKITSAQDDASGYAISERMRVQIRSLNQDTQNVQNGSSMLRVAEGGVQSIVDVLREMKALAINAANDSNTDEDRQTIQKELQQRILTINEVALGTEYNGKRLIDGTYDPKIEYAEMPDKALKVAQAMMSSFNETTLQGVAALDEAVKSSTGGKFNSRDELVSAFMSDLNSAASYTDFLVDKCGIILGNDDTGAITGSDAGGETTKTAESIVPEKVAVSSWGVPTAGSTTTINGLTIHWPTEGVTAGTLSTQEEHILAGLNSDWIEQCTNLVKESFGIDFTEEGASVHDISVTFENNSSNNRLAAVGHSYNPATGKATDLTLIVNMHYYDNIDMTSEDGATSTSGAGYLDRTLAHEFTHAIMAANIDHFSQLPKFIKEGTAELVHGIDDERPGVMRDLLTTRKSDLENILSGSIDGSGEDPYAAGYMFLRYMAKEGAGQTGEKVITSSRYNPLVIQHGTQAGQHSNYFLKDMQTKALTAGKIFDNSDDFINSNDRERYKALSGDSKKQDEWLETLRAAADMTIDDVSVTTIKNANIAIRVLDGALEYALDQATTIGAYLQRLEYTADNITTMNENVQASESVIRDADMAKTMTNYTKSNLLMQAAQSMLAQANQAPSAVLSLLQ